MLNKKISFIGFGRMGSALAAGAIAGRVISRSKVTVFDPDRTAIAAARRMKLHVASSEAASVLRGDIVFLCVKPQQMADTLSRLSEVAPTEIRKRCFVSIAAGVPLSRLEKKLGAGTPVLRVMPNTPALLKAGASAVSRGSKASATHEKWVSSILSAVGVTISVPEKAMDAVTAVSGSGPAYVFYLAEAMTEAGVSLGLKPDLARRLARQTIFGAGLMLRERSEDASELRRQVTSPGGTTASAIAVFDAKGLKPLVQEALRAAAEKSAALARL